MKLCSSYFKIPEAEYASVVLRSGCSGTKPIAHIGFGITFLKPLIIWAGMFFVAAVTSQLLTQQDGKVCTLVPFDLRVEHMTAPLGIDEAFPRFSWKLKSNIQADEQTAYRIVVYPAPKKYSDGRVGGVLPPVWDTKTIKSSNSVNIS